MEPDCFIMEAYYSPERENRITIHSPGITMLRSWPLLFFVVPLIEIYLLIQVGGIIGALWTVMLVILTAVVGIKLLRYQGLSTLSRAQQSMAQGQLPAMEMLEGIFLAVGGALLITPGFLTDAIGLMCLFPLTRQAILSFIVANSDVKVGGFGSQSGFYSRHPGSAQEEDKPHRHVGQTIEGEYTRKDD